MQELPERLGRKYAWQVGKQWHYANHSSGAPPDAIVVDGLLVDGEVVLFETTGATGRRINGATLDQHNER